MADHKQRRSSRWWWVAGIVIALGVIGWLAYQYWLSNVLADNAAQSSIAALEADWQQAGEPSALVDGQAFAIVRIPALGDDYAWPIVAGTTDLDGAVGWYNFTAEPGELGNFALAGHRITHGAPFADILSLKLGDEVIVETQAEVFTYEIVVPPADLTVSASETWVLDPVPGKPELLPWESTLTLTTAQDLIWSNDRSVGFATLVEKKEKG